MADASLEDSRRSAEDSDRPLSTVPSERAMLYSGSIYLSIYLYLYLYLYLSISLSLSHSLSRESRFKVNRRREGGRKKGSESLFDAFPSISIHA